MPKLDPKELKPVRNVIVFGDSLSDIGTKWKTKAGKMAQELKKMYVSPTGRFSDCRNWTDFMYEEATKGQSLIRFTAKESIQCSQQHTTLDSTSVVAAGPDKWFVYANYAEGGACGDTPWSVSKRPFLGTFEDQIKTFKMDVAAVRKKWTGHFNPEDPTLFIIWFGANDLFTAKRPYEQMSLVAVTVAKKMREKLRAFAPNSKFIFVNLSQPTSSVRYQTRRKEAMDNSDEKIRKAVLDKIDALGKGVKNFNAELKTIVQQNGDRVAELDTFITEHSLDQLIKREVGLEAGAEDQPSTVHYNPDDYRRSHTTSKLTVIDQAHPTDRTYELIWKLIRQQIKLTGVTFGHLFEESLSKDSTDMYRNLKDIKGKQPTPFDRGLM